MVEIYLIIIIGILLFVIIAVIGYFAGKKVIKLGEKGRLNVRIIGWFLLTVIFLLNIIRQKIGINLFKIVNELGLIFCLINLIISILKRIKII
ncbi:hypothetical protein DRQ09_04735 [candidate division KSB1 bacterium]|nr:MAG: hypothetical protein DRQ09_04735 [candidate division KSB1 bacterium]